MSVWYNPWFYVALVGCLLFWAAVIYLIASVAS